MFVSPGSTLGLAYRPKDQSKAANAIPYALIYWIKGYYKPIMR